MPHPAIDKLKQTITFVAKAGDKAVRTAAPVVRKGVGEVRSRVRGAEPGPAAASPTSPPAATASPAEVGEVGEVGEVNQGGTPSPASIAKNVPHQRPVARPAPTPAPSPDDVPGGKLPPRR
ncbi:hypothetical protein [Nocardioides sp.]|uniref:hypothetical protein n=1 Tax=Nocardioides sp. TaxID=35761 RepID=UPI0027293E84|nr:hypothetical protein [Nocardioides sp.]MDO9457028.1 hypothetical protein [Nocardioides sp.]